MEQPDARYLKSEATCVSPAVYYRVCSDCGYQTPSTFESGDIDLNNHDLDRHDEVKAPPARKRAGAPTIPAPAATTAPIGILVRWDIPMKPTRFSPPARRRGISCIPASAARPAISTPLFPATATGTANGRRTATLPAAPTARRNGCRHTGKALCEPLACRLLLKDAEVYDFTLCPVCGELVLRIGDLQNGERMLSVGFEYGGRLTQPTGQVEISLPAALLDGYTLCCWMRTARKQCFPTR